MQSLLRTLSLINLVLLLLSVSHYSVSAFTLVAKTSQQSTSTSLHSTCSRNDFVRQSLQGLLVATTLIPTTAHADITNKVASTSALRNVKSAQKALSTLQDAVTALDYATFRGALRQAPLSEVRKACTILVRGGDDGPEADKLQQTYKTFITTLEKVDATALVAMRGRKIPDDEFPNTYAAANAALADFVAVAERAAAIPVQYTESDK